MFTLKDGKILDEWSNMLGGCAGMAEELIAAVEGRIRAQEAPGVATKRESVAPGWIKGLFGKRRDYLIVTNERFDEFMLCVGARDYGKNLDIAWYLTASPKLFGKSVAAGDVDLDVFDKQDLRAYVTIAHHAVLDAVEDVMKRQNLDVSRLDRKSRGRLGIA